MNQHTHAGGIVARDAGGRREFLLVRARRSSAWVFPKGHVEDGESLAQAAVREVGEEAGVAAEVVGEAGATQYSVGSEPVSVFYFVMRYRGEVPVSEGRQRRWCDLGEARQRLTYANLEPLLDVADRVLG